MNPLSKTSELPGTSVKAEHNIPPVQLSAHVIFKLEALAAAMMSTANLILLLKWLGK